MAEYGGRVEWLDMGRILRSRGITNKNDDTCEEEEKNCGGQQQQQQTRCVLGTVVRVFSWRIRVSMKREKATHAVCADTLVTFAVQRRLADEFPTSVVHRHPLLPPLPFLRNTVNFSLAYQSCWPLSESFRVYERHYTEHSTMTMSS
ncbi:hypothetical protein WN55_10838 [Dufourea novaeangliae]|uniref:Uncharacterized protein n=1 Tax=Dufourea novaeangliae TaxID=178035 RepID=A0A154PBF5_DUFNO|nr:hypothetical protein WN55_10838 [Dufourea novaeangliae]